MSVFALVLGVLTPAGNAYEQSAIDCDQAADEKLEEVTRGDQPGVNWRSSEGVRATHIARPRDWNADECVGLVMGSGVMIRYLNASGQMTNKYAMIGWESGFITIWGDIGGGVGTEGINAASGVPAWCWFSCLASIPWNYYYECDYRVNRVSGTTNWKASVRCLNNPWYTVETFENTGYTKGVPMAVTWRRGGTSTGMGSEFSNLLWRNAAGDWNPWTGNAHWKDTATNWWATHITDTSFSVERI